MKMIMKHAELLGQRPFNMTRASQALKDWVKEVNPPSELLDVSYCQRPGSHSYSQPPTTCSNVAPQDFEVRTADVTVGNAPGARPKRPRASEEAKFVYSTAAELVRDDQQNWDDALKLARSLWARLPKSTKSKGRKTPKEKIAYDLDLDDEHSDVEPAALDIPVPDI